MVAVEYVGGRMIFEALEKQELLKPRIRTRRFVVYDRYEIDAACDAFRSVEED
jgi:hypothetical protein